MQKRVDITIENQIAHVRMVRSDKMNALDNDMMEAMIAAGERLKNEAGLRAIVLSGEGRAFCAGLDMGKAKLKKSFIFDTPRLAADSIILSALF